MEEKILTKEEKKQIGEEKEFFFVFERNIDFFKGGYDRLNDLVYR